MSIHPLVCLPSCDQDISRTSDERIVKRRGRRYSGFRQRRRGRRYSRSRKEWIQTTTRLQSSNGLPSSFSLSPEFIYHPLPNVLLFCFCVYFSTYLCFGISPPVFCKQISSWILQPHPFRCAIGAFRIQIKILQINLQFHKISSLQYNDPVKLWPSPHTRDILDP